MGGELYESPFENPTVHQRKSKAALLERQRNPRSFFWAPLSQYAALSRVIRAIRRAPTSNDDTPAMDPELRRQVYLRQTGAQDMTPRQRRRYDHKINRALRRAQ